MLFCKENYQLGYDAAFVETYSTAGNPEHAESCRESRVCRVVRSVMEGAVHL